MTVQLSVNSLKPDWSQKNMQCSGLFAGCLKTGVCFTSGEVGMAVTAAGGYIGTDAKDKGLKVET